MLRKKVPGDYQFTKSIGLVGAEVVGYTHTASRDVS